jgi:hypothetical protein
LESEERAWKAIRKPGMSSRVQAHNGPLPNEPTSQGWISVTSITAGQAVGSQQLPTNSQRGASDIIAARRGAPGWLGWLGLARHSNHGYAAEDVVSCHRIPLPRSGAQLFGAVPRVSTPNIPAPLAWRLSPSGQALPSQPSAAQPVDFSRSTQGFEFLSGLLRSVTNTFVFSCVQTATLCCSFPPRAHQQVVQGII